MFRKMTMILAIAALVACAACNNVTGPASSGQPTTVSPRPGFEPQRNPQIDPNKVELGDPGDDGGGGGNDRGPVKEEGRGGTIRNGRITPSKSGGGPETQPVKGEVRRDPVGNGQSNPS